MRWPPTRTRFVQPEPPVVFSVPPASLPVLPRNAFDDAEDWDPFELEHDDFLPPPSPGCEWDGLAPDG